MEKIPDLKAGNGWNGLDSWPFWGFARFECFGFVDCCVVGFVPVAVENEEHMLEVRVAPQDYFSLLDDTDRGRSPFSGNFHIGCGEAQFSDQAAELVRFSLAAFGEDHDAFPLFATCASPTRIPG